MGKLVCSVKGFKLNKFLNSQFKKAIKNVMFSTKKQKNEIQNAIKKAARRQGIKFAAKGIVKSLFGYWDAVVFRMALVYGYSVKYRKVK